MPSRYPDGLPRDSCHVFGTAPHPPTEPYRRTIWPTVVDKNSTFAEWRMGITVMDEDFSISGWIRHAIGVSRYGRPWTAANHPICLKQPFPRI